MKISAVLLIALAVLIAVVPPLTECAREGKALATAAGGCASGIRNDARTGRMGMATELTSAVSSQARIPRYM